VQLTGHEVGAGRPLFLIAGPCVVEGAALTQEIAGRLKEITTRLGIPFIFKASYDRPTALPAPASAASGSRRA